MTKFFSKFHNKKKGFTLIELIVVIAILGILAAILVPTMLGVIQDSRQNVANANARSVYTAAKAVYVQNGGLEPAATVTNATATAYATSIQANLGSGIALWSATIAGNDVTKATATSADGTIGNYPPLTVTPTPAP